MSIRGGKLQVVSEQTEHSARLIIQSENGDTANCLRARASLNATDNTIMEYAERRTDRDMGQLSGSSIRPTY